MSPPTAQRLAPTAWRSRLPDPGEVGKRALGADGVGGFGHVLAVFVVYAIVDALTRRASNLDADALGQPVLASGALAGNLAWLGLLAAGIGLAALRSPARFVAGWAELDHGRSLRWMATPLLVILTWQGALYDYNFVVDQGHVPDRALLVALAAASWFRPAFLVGFVVEFRVIADQFAHPFGSTFGQNIDELVVIALVALAATHLAYVVTGRADTTPALMVMAAAVATHFFVPGRGKLGLGWLEHNEPENLPLNGYVAGWMGGGDGRWAEGLSDLIEATGPVPLLAVMAIEVGAVLAALHYRLLRLWLPLAIAFHLAIFASMGFWFLSWITLEVVLLAVLCSRGNRDWVARTATPARAGLMALAVVALGAALFHPPRLSWLDAPVGYGFELEAVGADGESRHVPISALAPYEQELAFVGLRLRPTPIATAGYGAVGSTDRYLDLSGIEDLDQLGAYESTLGPATIDPAAEDFLLAWVDHVNHGSRSAWSALAPPDHFWTSRPAPTHDLGEPIQRLTVILVTALQPDGHATLRREVVLTIAVGDDGQARVVDASADS